MTRTWIAGIVVAALLAIPTMARAHEGHTHKVLGTVTSVQGAHVMLKTTAGKDMMVMVDQKTTITRGKDKVDTAALKAGDRVSVDYMEDKGMMMAQAIKLGAPTAAKK